MNWSAPNSINGDYHQYESKTWARPMGKNAEFNQEVREVVAMKSESWKGIAKGGEERTWRWDLRMRINSSWGRWPESPLLRATGRGPACSPAAGTDLFLIRWAHSPYPVPSLSEPQTAQQGRCLPKAGYIFQHEAGSKVKRNNAICQPCCSSYFFRLRLGIIY